MIALKHTPEMEFLVERGRIRGVFNLKLRNAFKVFSLNMEGENLIEFQNVASYILELLRIFNSDLKKRPETVTFGAFRNLRFK